MHRTNHLHHERIAHLVGEIQGLLLLVNDADLLLGDACSVEQFVYLIRADVAILAAVDALADAGGIDLRHLHVLGLRLRGVIHLADGITQHALLREVDAALGNEVLNLVLHVDDGRQHGEDGLLAGLHLLVEQVVDFFVAEQARRAEDDHREVDVGVVVLDGVDDIAKLFGRSCRQEIDGVAHA